MMQNTLTIRRDFLGAIQSLPECSQTRTIERMSDSAPNAPQPPENVPTAAHNAPGARPDGEDSPGTRQKGKRRANTMVHTARVVHALTALADGSASNKREAAERMGISHTALAPSRIAEALSSSHAASLLSVDPLDITANHEGERVSLRDVLSKGMESAIATLASLRPLIGKMDKTQREAFRQAKDWLTLCRDNGLWKTPVGMPTLPGLPIAPPELDEESTPGSAPWYLAQMRARHTPEGTTECGGIAPVHVVSG